MTLWVRLSILTLSSDDFVFKGSSLKRRIIKNESVRTERVKSFQEVILT